MSGYRYSEAHYKIAVPSGATKLDITIGGGTGDCDLYVKQGQQASRFLYDYRPYLNGNNEAVSVNTPASGDWYIMLRGYYGYSGVTLKAVYTDNLSYIISARPEKIEYLPGEKAVFVGSLKTSSGQAVSNYRIGVDDSIELLCKLGPYTDSLGNFRYESTPSPSSSGVYGLTFYGGSAKAFCIVHIKGTFAFQISNPNHIVKLGATLDTSDINFAYTGKIGNGLRQSTPQELLDTDKIISTFMAGAGKAALIDFVKSPLNDVAALASGACLAGVWTGVGTIPCVAIYKWTIKSATKSIAAGAIVQAIEMSDLSADQKQYWKGVAIPGVKCVIGIGLLNPSSATAEISAIGTGWKCGQTIVNILSDNNQSTLTIAAVPSSESQSKVSMFATLIPLQESQLPGIAFIAPTCGTAGTSVTINGSNFGATQGASSVKFGTAAATVTSWSDTKIVAIAPSGSGSPSVTVTTTVGTSNGVPFAYKTAAPVISYISPTSGTAGTPVTVNGSYFGATQGASSVKFGSAAATVASWSDSKIVAIAPSGSGSPSVTVTTISGTSNGAQFTYKTAQSERITNGSFSNGASGWSLTGDFWAGTNLSNYRTPPGYAAGGVNSSGTPKNNANGSMYQTVSIPSNATNATLSFWYYITSEETYGYYDYLNVTIQNSSGNYLTTVAVLSNANKGTAYSQKTLGVSQFKGQTIRVHFWAKTDSSKTTVFRIDDVSLMSDGN